jgi:biotin carboxylase
METSALTGKKILVIGAGPLQLPAYSTARRMGLRTIAIDRNAKAPGMAIADYPYAVDTHDVTEILRIASAEGVSGIVTLCTDAPVRVVAEVSSRLGLRSLSCKAASQATDKGLMRDALRLAGVPIPDYRKCHSFHETYEAAKDIGFPVILKPPASSGSRGIYKASSPKDLEEGYKHARAVAGEAPYILVEEFIEGPEVSVETVSFEKRHSVIAITDKRTSGDPHWVETGHVEPSRLGNIVQTAIAALARASLEALDIDCAAGHVEIKVSPSGPRVIEVGARLGGDYITTELVPRSTGVDMVQAVLQMALGIRPTLEPSRQRGAAIRYLKSPRGRVRGVGGLDRAIRMPGVARAEMTVGLGDLLEGGVSSADRSGFVICEGATAEEAEARAAEAANAITIHMD